MLWWCKAQEIIWWQDWPWFVLQNVCGNNFKTLTLNAFTMPSVAFRKQLTDLEVDKENRGNKAAALYLKNHLFSFLYCLAISLFPGQQMDFSMLDFYKFTEQISEAWHVIVWELGLLTSKWGVGRSEDGNSLSLHWGCETQLPSLHEFLRAPSSTDARWNGNTALTDTRGCYHFMQKSQSGRGEVESKGTGKQSGFSLIT